MPLARRLAAYLGSLCLLAGLARAQPAPAAAQMQATGERTVYDDTTKETVLTGHARLVNGDTLLTADEIRYNAATHLATARGNLVIARGPRRLVADSGTYDTASGQLEVRNLRIGEFPVYVSGESVSGTLDVLVFTNATIFFRENAGYTPSVKARRLTYARGRIVRAEGLSLGLHGGHFISLPQFQHTIGADFVSFISAHLGYRGNLGVFTELGLHLPLAPGFQAGAELGLYSRRGIMAGPSGSYHAEDDDGTISGSFRSGHINDSGDRRNDLLGRPVPRDRSFFTWQHRQRNGEGFTLDGQLNYWSDSEILRDFRHREFDRVQQPDSFLEAAHTRDNWSVSAFGRVRPNSWQRATERLPEMRFDLLPSSAPLGFYQRGSASTAYLRSATDGSLPEFSTERLDAYYSLERPWAPTPWFNLTPVAGARITHYSDARNGRTEYTRTLGELGFDTRLVANRTFELKNEIWEIDGLRHLVEPRLSYRYVPGSERGTRYLPPIDTRAFSTYLQPLSLGDTRALDELRPLNTLRLSLDNLLQTRDRTYGSRNLASLDLAADYRFDHPGERPLSDLHTAFALTPAPWLRFEVYQRIDPHTSRQQEFNTTLALSDREWWSARLATHYLRDNYQEYHLEYRHRLNEVLDVTGLWRYDARNRRLNEQSYAIWHRLGQTWAVKYEVSWFNGPRRESSFALNLEVELLKF
jgi:LPS-assembly protein